MMKNNLLLLSLFIFTSSVALGDPLIAPVSNSQRVIQDPKTKVIYYLESDLRHIAALSPDGKSEKKGGKKGRHLRTSLFPNPSS